MSDTEITAELTVPASDTAPPPSRPSVFAHVTFGAKSDLGRVRENNEDKFDWLEPEAPSTLAARGRLYLVADGMGGHAAGQIASEMTAKTVLRSYFAATHGSVEDALADAIRKANALVWEAGQRIPGREGMGTTITALLLHEGRAVIGQVGDSRLYLLRKGEIQQVTEDHSWVAEQVSAGLLTVAEAELSPYRNIITRSIGAQADVEPDLFDVELIPRDTFLLCSDGLSGPVTDVEIREIAGACSPSEAASRLVDLANQHGGPDNITVFIVRVDDLISWEDAVKAGGFRDSDLPPDHSDAPQSEASETRDSHHAAGEATGALVSTAPPRRRRFPWSK